MVCPVTMILMIKQLFLATVCGGVMCATPALAQSDYIQGYRDGANFGSWAAFCNAYTEGDYKDPGLARHMTLASFDELIPENKQWARENNPNCAR